MSMDLKRRVATAVVLAPPAIALILFAPSAAIALVLGALVAVAALEWSPLADCSGPLRPWMYSLAMVVAMALTWLVAFDEPRVARTLLAAALLWWAFATLWVARRWALGRGTKLVAGAFALLPAW